MSLKSSFLFAVLGGLVIACESAQSHVGPATSPASASAPMDWIHASGTRLLDSQGNAVALHGVNIGGWLVEEMWMMPLATTPPDGNVAAKIIDHVTLWNTITSRLGPKDTADVRAALRNAWFDESDMDRIQAAGFNCIRLPFLYSLLDEPDGWCWLDRALDWAKQRHIYVVLDLHGAPGGQNKAQHCGQAGVNRFFKDPAEIAHGCAVWKRIAERYRDRPEVVGYDLLNEPMGAPNGATLFIVQDQLIHAIHQVDPQHMIFIEDGYLGMAAMPNPEIPGWTNVVYSFHDYKFDSKSADDQRKGAEWFVDKCAKAQADWKVPLYIGEFNQMPFGNGQTLGDFTKAMDSHGWAWTIWCYKVVMANMAKGDGGMWGLYHATKPVDLIDPFQDTAQQMIAKTAQYRTDRLTMSVEVKTAMEK